MDIVEINLTFDAIVWPSLGENIVGYYGKCGSPPGVMMADTLSFNAKIGVVDFWV